MITLRVKTKSGHIQSLVVESIVDIDGVPYRPEEHVDCRANYAYLSGRLDQMEKQLSRDEYITGTAAV